MSPIRATFIGFFAVLLWALLALLTVWSSPVPPFQLSAICFSIGAIIGLIWAQFSGGLAPTRLSVIAFGSLGLFGYHALYFWALRLAPPAQAGLVAYLWPLLIVLFSGLLPGERLRPMHILGAIAGFAGAAVIITEGGQLPEFASLSGLGLAFLCALIWAGYSVLSRRLGEVPSSAVTYFCAASAVMSVLCHIIFEDTLWPTALRGWGALLVLGLGPVGLAFFLWDFGVKRGDIQLLGTAAYAAPLLSTLVLILAGIAEPSPRIFIAAALITGGAALAARASAKSMPSGV